jgi:hypothetical protein
VCVQLALPMAVHRAVQVDVAGDRVLVRVLDQHRGAELARLEMSAREADNLAGYLTGAVTEIVNRTA